MPGGPPCYYNLAGFGPPYNPPGCHRTVTVFVVCFLLVRDDEGHPKGDGSVCYAKAESVEMAINVLHEGQLRPGVTIEVRDSTCPIPIKWRRFPAVVDVALTARRGLTSPLDRCTPAALLLLPLHMLRGAGLKNRWPARGAGSICAGCRCYVIIVLN